MFCIYALSTVGRSRWRAGSVSPPTFYQADAVHEGHESASTRPKIPRRGRRIGKLRKDGCEEARRAPNVAPGSHGLRRLAEKPRFATTARPKCRQPQALRMDARLNIEGAEIE